MNKITEQIRKKLSITDASGNVFNCEENGRLSLKLKTNPIKRYIGTIKLIDSPELEGHKVLAYIKKDLEGQTYRKLNAWSIPSDILKLVYSVSITTELANYYITSEDAFKSAVYFHFNKTTEKKIYIPKGCFKITLLNKESEQDN